MLFIGLQIKSKMNLINKPNKFIIANCDEEHDYAHGQEPICKHRSALLLDAGEYETATIGFYDDDKLEHPFDCDNLLKDGSFKYYIDTYIEFSPNEIRLNATKIKLDGEFHNDHLEDHIQMLVKKNDELETRVSQLEKMVEELIRNG